MYRRARGVKGCMSTNAEHVLRHRSETFILRLTAVDDGQEPPIWHGSLQRVSTGQIMPLRELSECLEQLRQWLDGAVTNVAGSGYESIGQSPDKQ